MLSWEGAWRGGLVMSEMCVAWLEVESYVWPNVCLEWLQVVSGQVLSGGSMYICGSMSEWVTLMCWLVLGKPGSRPCALCRGCYLTSFIIRGGLGRVNV